MATITGKNITAKALQAQMAKAKKHSARSLLEWEMACNTNSKRGHVYNQEELNDLYSRDSWDSCKHGATKTCHLKSHEGRKFKYIVVKRHQTNGYIPDAHRERAKITGNQLIDEINCWLEYMETETADLLCPILKYFTSKSDKVTAISETMQENVVIIAQKAVFVGDAEDACKEAQRLNEVEGYNGEGWRTRYTKLEALSDSKKWRDAMYNGGNSGVIFDYSKNCYKAVFIDYAL